MISVMLQQGLHDFQFLSLNPASVVPASRSSPGCSFSNKAAYDILTSILSCLTKTSHDPDQLQSSTPELMLVTLEGLPFDVLFYISSFLEFDDIASLAYTCKQLKTLLQENGVCRKAIEVFSHRNEPLIMHVKQWQARFRYTKESRLAQEQRISYSDAFSWIQDRRNAFFNAHPFSARVVGRANDFCYRQGILCILEGNIICTSDVHSQAEGVTIDLSQIPNAFPELSTSSDEAKLSLLCYNDEIVTICCQRKGRPNNGRIIAIDTKFGVPNANRLLESVPLQSTHRIFARHTSKYLYYGTYSSVGYRGHYEWEIQGVSFDDTHPLPCNNSLQLSGFFGNDIGSTVAFEIHNNYFYAVSNQTSYEAEEIDWTSFYHCMRFPLNNPNSGSLESNNRLWRRQHDEGVIHDSWIDLSIQIDETTDKAVIVEARREYQKNCGRQVRTYYTSAFVSGPESSLSASEESPVSEVSTGPMLPYDDAYVQTLDATNNPNYAPPEPRYNGSFHPEVPRSSNPGRSFILARTKFRGYNNSCSSFLDLVEDDRCCNDPSASCLRLRIGSRRVAPPDWKELWENTPQLVSPPALPGDVAYRHSTAKMWPPPASRCPCSKRLHRILNPPLPGGPAYNRSVIGALDERSLVYMIRSGRSYSPSDDNVLGIIVAINFNRGPISAKKESQDCADRMEGQFNESEWHWVRGACRNGTCR